MEYTFGKGTNLVYNETCGDERTIVFTVTNLNMPATAITTVDSRLLADATNKRVGLTFSSTATPDSASYLIFSAFAIILSFAVFF